VFDDLATGMRGGEVGVLGEKFLLGKKKIT
jgi:hypothetical protein